MTTTNPRYYESLGRAITLLRTEQGIERKELADTAGISYSYLAEIENGNKPASSRVLLQISKALGLGMTQLMASAESLLTRQKGETVVAPVALPSSARGSTWFHAAASQVSPAPDTQPPLKQRRRALEDLQLIVAGLNDDDLERVLDLARRLQS
jgi:transcriptional regulator with XRE-family HTH domain